ncbi:MAG: glycoside hydrolase family 2, partial [Tannerella sp.]|nr:glycoside hydrolase family 2 [Tannerella sp.]
MNRRTFIARSSLLSGGMLLFPFREAKACTAHTNRTDAFESFVNPEPGHRPFVRWWWNGNRVQPGELVRELHLLREAGFGGVEINPVKFPNHTDDLGIPALEWLGDEWIDAVKTACDEAGKLGLTCDLIVGSGWPFGGKFLKDEERGQVVVIGVTKLEGPMTFETSLFNLLKEADPGLSEPYSGRLPQLLSLRLAPDPISRMEEEIDLTDRINGSDVFRIDIPKGKHALYSLVKINAFGEVINGAPGADGPTLNHLDKDAVTHYLTRMSDTIERRIGPLSGHIRALFTDGLELEGANWTEDMEEVFRRRNGYDIMPYLPYVLFKTEGMGNVSDYNYGVGMSSGFREMIERMRFDLETTKAEMFLERFIKTYADWCRRLNVLSRVQAYGRGLFPLETSMVPDIPEGESWTTNYLQHRIGEEMSNEDYRRGRSYTMVNKYVSSAAHLAGRRLISAEEMTNTYRVFNMTLEFLKVGCDM